MLILVGVLLLTGEKNRLLMLYTILIELTLISCFHLALVDTQILIVTSKPIPIFYYAR